MKRCDSPSTIRIIRCLIGQAEQLLQSGKLLKAAMNSKKATALLTAALKNAPKKKSLLKIKLENEKCWNKIIDAMAKSMRQDFK
jgi:hypothetical protein